MVIKENDRVKIKRRSKSKYKGMKGTVRAIHGRWETKAARVTVDIDGSNQPLITTLRNCKLLESPGQRTALRDDDHPIHLSDEDLDFLINGHLDIDFGIDIPCSSAPAWLRQPVIEERGAEEMNTTDLDPCINGNQASTDVHGTDMGSNDINCTSMVRRCQRPSVSQENIFVRPSPEDCCQSVSRQEHQVNSIRSMETSSTRLEDVKDTMAKKID